MTFCVVPSFQNLQKERLKLRPSGIDVILLRREGLPNTKSLHPESRIISVIWSANASVALWSRESVSQASKDLLVGSRVIDGRTIIRFVVVTTTNIIITRAVIMTIITVITTSIGTAIIHIIIIIIAVVVG